MQPRVVCNGGEYVTFSRNDGSIVLHDLPAGVHLVDIYLLDYVFPELRVDVSKKVKGRIRVAYNDGSKIVLDPLGRSHGEALGDGAVSVAPIARHKFFIPREEFSVMSIFKNPMILLSLVSVGLFYIMPKDEMKKGIQRPAENGLRYQEETVGEKRIVKHPPGVRKANGWGEPDRK